ncbi:hypothetical protein NMG60_11015357 [Bertholletia excelsa]
MAAIVEVWIGELAKLGEKVPRPLLLNLKKRRNGGQKEGSSYPLVSVKSDAEEKEELSEATICLLMDRFVPL